MFLTLWPDSATPIYEQVVAQVCRAIERGDLEPGDALPSVRALATELEINPNTVAKAYLLLERDGVIECRPRKGCYVGKRAAQAARAATGKQLQALVDRLVAEGESLGLSREALLTRVRDQLQQPHPEVPHDD